MGLETGDFIEDLDPNWPLGTDPKNEGDDHIRLIKETIQGSFPGTSGAWTTDQSAQFGELLTLLGTTLQAGLQVRNDEGGLFTGVDDTGQGVVNLTDAAGALLFDVLKILLADGSVEIQQALRQEGAGAFWYNAGLTQLSGKVTFNAVEPVAPEPGDVWLTPA